MRNDNSILFLGDVVPYKPFKFNNGHKTIINLECPLLTEGEPVSGKINLGVRKNYLPGIFKNNLIAVSLGNNHMLDYGLKGLNTTLEKLEESNIRYFGINKPGDDSFNPLVIDFCNDKIALFSVISESTTPVIEFDDFNHLSLFDPDELIDKVSKIRSKVKRIIVCIHWGIEESSYPTLEDIITARKLIDAGVDIIIGNHAHAPQAVEKYNNGIIAYSLGNFMMPEFENTPSYFDDEGKPQSSFSKKLMLWNRISWGLIIDMKNLEFRIKKFWFLGNRVIELPFTPLDKYIRLLPDISSHSYLSIMEKHIKRRALLRKIKDFIYRPRIPQKLRRR